MKKIMMALVASTMLVSFSAPTFAAFNPANIDESSHSANIYKVIDKKIAKGKTSGVQGMFAWAEVDGEVYSVALRELRKYADPGKQFSEIVGQEVMISIAEKAEDNIVALKQAIVEMVVASVDQEVIDLAKADLVMFQADLNLLNDRISGLDLSAAEAARDAAIEARNDAAEAHQMAVDARFAEGRIAGAASVGADDGITQADVTDATTRGTTDGTASVTPEDGWTQARIDAAVMAIESAMGEGSAYAVGFAAGMLEGASRTDVLTAINAASGTTWSIAANGDLEINSEVGSVRLPTPLGDVAEAKAAYASFISATIDPQSGDLVVASHVYSGGRDEMGTKTGFTVGNYYNSVAAGSTTGATQTILSPADINAINDAVDEAFNNGYNEGYTVGFNQGYTDGFTDGVNSVTSN